jgi:hypothetical protein
VTEVVRTNANGGVATNVVLNDITQYPYYLVISNGVATNIAVTVPVTCVLETRERWVLETFLALQERAQVFGEFGVVGMQETVGLRRERDETFVLPPSDWSTPPRYK